MTKKLLSSLLLIFTFLFGFLFFSPQNVLAVSCSINSQAGSYSTGDTITMTLTYDGVDTSGNFPEFFIELQGTSNSFRQTVVASYPVGQSPKSFQISSLVPSGQYQIIAQSVNPGRSDQCQSGSNITINNTGGGGGGSTASCSFSPTTINENQLLTVTAQNLPYSGFYQVLFNGVDDTQHDPVPRDSSNGFTTTFYPSVFTIGANETRTVSVGGPSSFTLACTPAQLNYTPIIRITQPASTITQTDMRTLPVLTISGLTPNWEYTIKLTEPEWTGADLVHSQLSGDARYRWQADSSGTITAQNICENGQADRTASGIGGACSDTFDAGAYIMTIIQLDGRVVKPYLEFHVGGSGSGNSSGQAGKNPCIAGTSGSCLTAIGRIPTNATAFVGSILTIAISLAGGIALIIMVIGAVKLLMSANDPQKVANGRDMIIAALAGLLFLIFSVLILRYLGSNLFNFFTAT